MSTQRLTGIRTAQPSQDGDGVKIRRIHDFRGGLDPFLMLDELKASAKEDYIGGFPPHPHRGFETLTYILHGGLTHEDSMGNKGEVHAGDAQWMSAAHGVIHSEMPLLDSDGLHAFQMWINLPAHRKLEAPQYRDLRDAEMGHLNWPDGHLKAIAGHWQTSAGETTSSLAQVGEQAALADLQLQPSTQLDIHVPAGQQLLVYVYAAELEQGIKTGQLGTFAAEDSASVICLQASASETTGVLLLTGPALKEPIAHYGPFVMNTEVEIQQAMQDYQSGQLTARS
ncbi:MAG: pirin family protein [Marinospirillum sp.]|uniref:pirin family protein n=1 Tax=Marinospirillum sp. TaxID=2183934 RepID=UPI001A0727FE|nr:pirin family protein [Marinospirillum sp.]MBE0508251.1 pirin family protein [Marinospirillum sp.]